MTNYKKDQHIPYWCIQPPADQGGERCLLDVYYPENMDGYATVIWFHGGGLTQGERHVPEQLMQQGFAVVPVGYRLHPQVKAPSYIEDAAAATAWVFKHIESYGGSPERIFIAGASAGGYLAAMITLDRHWLAAHGEDANRVAGLIAQTGQFVTHFTVRAERGIPGHRIVVDEWAPLYHVRADAPPILLVTGDRDLELLGRYEENAYFQRMMKVAGHNKTELHELKGHDHAMVEAPAHAFLVEFVQRIMAASSPVA